MKYILFYTGLASTPNTIGILCVTTKETLFEFNVSMPSGKQTRKKYNKIKDLLSDKYCSILN